jgi:hypothetical protein
MLMYVYTSPNRRKFKINSDILGEGTSGFQSEDVRVFYADENFLTQEFQKKDIKENIDIFVGWSEINKSFQQDSVGKVRKFLDDKTKFIILDDIGEYSFEFDRHQIYDFVNSNPNNYFISQRYINIEAHERILNNQSYLPLFFYYFNINEFLYIHPNLPNFDFQRITNQKYDFICYLGKDAWVADDKPWRGQFMDKIDFKDKKLLTPNTFHSLTSKNELLREYVENRYDLRFSDYGEYLVTSLFECMDAKVKLTFESFQILIDGEYHDNDVDQQFLTEKTLKCFLFTQPYIIVLNKDQHSLLEHFGFKLPFPSYQNGLIDFINNLMVDDNLDMWIQESNTSFKHNQSHLNNLLTDSTLPVATFFENLL